MGSAEVCKQNKSGAWSSQTICLSLSTMHGRSPAILLAPLLLAGLPDPSICDQPTCPSVLALNLHLMRLGERCEHCFQRKASAPENSISSIEQHQLAISKHIKNRRHPQSGPDRHEQELTGPSVGRVWGKARGRVHAGGRGGTGGLPIYLTGSTRL